jgi:hypothetical protein
MGTALSPGAAVKLRKVSGWIDALHDIVFRRPADGILENGEAKLDVLLPIWRHTGSRKLSVSVVWTIQSFADVR